MSNFSKPGKPGKSAVKLMRRIGDRTDGAEVESAADSTADAWLDRLEKIGGALAFLGEHIATDAKTVRRMAKTLFRLRAEYLAVLFDYNSAKARQDLPGDHQLVGDFLRDTKSALFHLEGMVSAMLQSPLIGEDTDDKEFIIPAEVPKLTPKLTPGKRKETRGRPPRKQGSIFLRRTGVAPHQPDAADVVVAEEDVPF